MPLDIFDGGIDGGFDGPLEAGSGSFAEASATLTGAATVLASLDALDGNVHAGWLAWYLPKPRKKREPPPEVEQIIHAVAEDAVENAAKAKVATLKRELAAAHIDYEKFYGQLLKAEYDKLLHEEIRRLMQIELQRRDEEEIALVMLLAA